MRPDSRSSGTLFSPTWATRLDGVHISTKANVHHVWAFFKTLDFDGFYENSAFRRDWRSSAHLLEGLGPHVSDPGWPKWLPQAPFKATTQNSAYRRDWRSPGAPITSK